MSKSVHYKLRGAEQGAVLEFCNQVGLPLEVVAKQSLLMTIQRAYQEAEQLRKRMQEDGNGIPETGVTSGDNAEGVLDTPPTDSSLLAEEETPPPPSPAA